MKRRFFLKLLGIGSVAPATVLAKVAEPDPIAVLVKHTAAGTVDRMNDVIARRVQCTVQVGTPACDCPNGGNCKWCDAKGWNQCGDHKTLESCRRRDYWVGMGRPESHDNEIIGYTSNDARYQCKKCGEITMGIEL